MTPNRLLVAVVAGVAGTGLDIAFRGVEVAAAIRAAGNACLFADDSTPDLVQSFVRRRRTAAQRSVGSGEALRRFGRADFTALLTAVAEIALKAPPPASSGRFQIT